MYLNILKSVETQRRKLLMVSSTYKIKKALYQWIIVAGSNIINIS
jgi:hypothetical protein